MLHKCSVNNFRIIWLLLVQCALVGTLYACLKQYDRYFIRPTVMTVEKDFRTWTGTLPAITICLNDVLDINKANIYIERKWGSNATKEDRGSHFAFLYAIMNTTIENYSDLAEYAYDENYVDINLSEIAAHVRKSVQDLVKVSSYDRKFHMEITPLVSEKGLCYVVNSALPDLVRERNILRKPLTCSYGKQQCFLDMDVYDEGVRISVHSPYELSGSESIGIFLDKSDEVAATYKIMETVASESLRDLNSRQRKCLFPDEDSPAYSKSLCYMKCRASMAMAMCGCIPYFYPFISGPECTVSGFECLLDFQWPGWSQNLCNCTQTCEKLTYPEIQITRRNWNTNANQTFIAKSSFHLELVPPKVRNRISVVFSFEDLLVSFGGAASLFLGFSIRALLNSVFLTLKHLIIYMIRLKSRMN